MSVATSPLFSSSRSPSKRPWQWQASNRQNNQTVSVTTRLESGCSTSQLSLQQKLDGLSRRQCPCHICAAVNSVLLWAMMRLVHFRILLSATHSRPTRINTTRPGIISIFFLDRVYFRTSCFLCLMFCPPLQQYMAERLACHAGHVGGLRYASGSITPNFPR